MIRLSLFSFLTLFALSQPACADDFAERSIEYLDKLKSCTPHSFDYINPIYEALTGRQVKNSNTIVGRDGDRCLVHFVLPENTFMKCAFSAEYIDLATSPSRYEKARQSVVGFSPADPSDVRESELMSQECVYIQNGKIIQMKPLTK